MGFIILLIGAFAIVAAYKGTYPTLGALLAQDAPAFAIWALAIVVIGGFGFIPRVRPIATAMLVLIFIAMILKNGGIFSQLQKLVTQGIPKVAPSATGFSSGLTFNPGSLFAPGNIPGTQSLVVP